MRYEIIPGDVCFRPPKGSKRQAVLIQSYQPATVSDRRRQVDMCKKNIFNA